MDKLKSWSLIIFGRAKKKIVNRRGRRGEEEGEEEEKRKGMKFVKFCMDFIMEV